MPTGRPKAMLTISSDERTQLVAITRSRSLLAGSDVAGEDCAGLRA